MFLAADISLSLADGIVVGLFERPTGYALINPSAEYRLSADEDLLVLRPTAVKQVCVCCTCVTQT